MTLFAYKGQKAEIKAININDDSSVCLSTSADRQTICWDILSNQCRFILNSSAYADFNLSFNQTVSVFNREGIDGVLINYFSIYNREGFNFAPNKVS